jgi:putative endopeptidase
MKKPLAAPLALLALAAACAPPERPEIELTELNLHVDARSICTQAQHGIESADLNRSIDPCTDFYEFANGTWRAENPIPAGAAAWGRRIASFDENRSRLKEILEQLSRREQWPAGSAEQLAGDHYASCMDEATIEALGLDPLAPWLDEIDAVRSIADVQRVLRELHAIAINVGFTVVGIYAYREPADFIAYVTAGSLGLPDRDYYLKDEPRFVEARDHYRAHIARLLALAGTAEERATQAAADILELETRLAAASLDAATASAPTESDHMAPYAKLKELAPHFDWDTYFDAAKLSRADLSINEAELLIQLEKEWTPDRVPTWKRYLTYSVLETAASSLSKPFVDESFAFKEQYLLGAIELKPRAARCLESTETWLSDALAKKYVERYFPPTAKKRLQGMLRALVSTLKQELASVQWLTTDTKAKALAKLETYNPLVGYPDTWRDYAGVRIRRDTYWANLVAARKFRVEDNRKLIGNPTPRDYWQLPATATGAYIDFQLGQIVLPAGFLLPPAFDVDATDAVNFGAIGISVAHDITHGIDPLGSENDERGRPVTWWTDADNEGFDRQAQCVVNQYEGYFIEPGVHFDGQQVRSEAVGDLAGARLAYLTLEKSLQHHAQPTLDGFTPEQQFFISWGQVRGAAETLERQRELVESDSHPTSKFRVIGPLASMPEFQKAFSCPAGAPMVRSPEQQCSVW